MRKKVVAALFVVGIVVSMQFAAGCATAEPDVNSGIEVPGPDRTYELDHAAWISIEDGDLGQLFRDVSDWITAHPDTEIIDVDIVNATKRSQGYAGYTLPSGALIVFR